MDNTLDTYDPQKLLNMVRDRIRATYVSLIPEEQWTNLVQKEIDAFFSRDDQRGYYANAQITPFRRIVYSVLEEHAKRVANEIMESMSHREWSGNGLVPGEYVKQLFAEKSSEILLGMLGGMVQNAINNATRY